MTSGLYPISFNDNGGLLAEEHITVEHAALWEDAAQPHPNRRIGEQS